MASTLRKCRFLAALGGLNDFVVSAAVPGFVLPVTAHAENLTYNYTAFFGNEFESGDGTYSISTTTLTRDIVLASSNNNDQLVDFSGPPIVIMTYATEPAAALPGRLIKSTRFITSDTWNKDSKTKNILAFATGGGAGSGFANGNLSSSGGAGAGATAISFLDVTNISSYPIVIGAAGNAGSTPSTAPGNGGNTTIGSTVVVANGGAPSANTGLDSPSNGGIGATTGTGDIVIPGGSGQSGSGIGGVGGSSFWGGGGSLGPGQAYGSGAGGAGANSNGFVGKPGLVWILEFA